SLWAGDYRRAEEILRRVLQTLEGDRSRERFGLAGFPAVLVRGDLTWALVDQGKVEEGAGLGREGGHLAEGLARPSSLTFASWALAPVHIARGELDHAARLLERGVAVSREWHLPLHSVQNEGLLGYAYVLSGRTTEGIPLLEDAVNAAEAMRHG